MREWEGLPVEIELLADYDKLTGKITKLYGFPHIKGVDAHFRRAIEVEELYDSISSILGLQDVFDDTITSYDSCNIILWCDVSGVQDTSRYGSYYPAFSIAFNNFSKLIIQF